MPLPDIPDTSWQAYQAAQFKQATDAAITGLTTSYGSQIDALRARVAPENRVWVDRAVAAAKRYNVDPYIYAKQIMQESGFSPTAGSNEGARGIAQFTDPTAKAFGIDAWNPDQSLDAGARYMRQNLNATGGDYALALASYNAGGGNVAKYGRNIFNPAYLRSQGWSEQDANQPATYIRNILGDQTPATAPVQPTMGAQQPAPAANPNAAWNQRQRASFNQAVQSGADTSAWSSVTVPPAPTISFRDHAQAKMDALGGADATQYPDSASPQIGLGTSPSTQNQLDVPAPNSGAFGGASPQSISAPLAFGDQADLSQPPTDNANLKDFASYATSKIASLGAQDASTTPPAPFGYNDMAGASSSPGMPAFGTNPQDATSPIDQARASGTAPQLLPGPTPLTDLASSTGLPQWAAANRQRQAAAFTPQLGTIADQPAREQPIGGSGMFARFTPSQFQAQGDITANAVMGSTGLETEGAPLAKPLLEGVGGKIGAALGRLASEDAGAIGRKAPTSSVDPMLKQAQKLVNDITNQASDALRGNDLPRYDAAQARLDQAQKVLDTLKDLRKNELMVARQKVAGPVTLPEGNPNAEIAPTPKQQATHDVVMAEQKTTGPVATAPPIPDAQATARAAVQGARLPNGQRAPIWMQAAPRALETGAVDLSLPAESPLRSRPAGALPSGRVPGSLGTTSKPYSPELAGAATERALAIPQKGFAQQVEDASGRFLRESYDRLYPLRELDKQAGLGPNVGSHATAQVFSGAIAAGEDAAQRYVMPLIKQLGPDGAELEKWWLLQQSRDVLAKFKDSKLPGNIDGLGGIQREEALIKQRLGPDRFAKVEAAADQLWKLNDELRLKPLEEAGIISKADRAKYRNENPHYLPFDRYVHSAEDPSNLLPRTSSNLSVSSSGIKARTAAGAVHALDQPMARWVSDIIQTPVVVSRNRAAKSIVDALKEAEKVTGQKLIVEAPESTAQAAKLGQMTVDRGSISYFDPAKPGVRMVANVPAIYATVAKGMEAETSNVLSRLASALATPLRLGATGLDPSFMVTNATRDLQSAFFREGLTPASPYYIAGLKAALARNTDFEAAAKAGALHSGLMETRKSTDAIKRAQQIQGIQVNNVQDALLLIPKLMAKAPQAILNANEVIEQAPRIGTFLKAQAEGASTLEAAVRARDVTVDFDKSGNAMRVLNQAVPFLNARAQGGANFVRVLKDNPKQAILRAAPLIVPEVLFWLWNQRYPSSSLIPPYEYDRSYIFQVGESTANPDPRNPNAPAQKIPIYIKIPKGDPSAVTTAPVTAMLQAAFQQGDRSAVELVLHAAQAATQGLSPIDPNVNSALSTLTPPLMATTQQIAQNRNTFTGRDIVPQGELGRPASQQYDQSTSRTAVALGEQFHVSPRLIDFAIRNYAGGTGHNAEWLSDLALGALGYNPQAPGQAMKQQLTPVQQAATLPGVSRFLGAKNTAEQIQSGQALQQATSDARDLLYQNPEIKRFGIGIQPVNSYITYDGHQVPLTPDEQVLYQTRLSQQMKKDLDALPGRQVYKNYKTDALRRQAIYAVMDHARTIVENQMIHDIGPISKRLKPAA